MSDVKSILQSKTIWGAILSLVSVGLTAAHIDLGPVDGWAEAIVGLVGGVLAVYGRVKAVKKIG